MYLKNIKKLYQCILFNDVLVFAHGDSRQSKVELQLDLEAVWFEDLEDLDPQTSEFFWLKKCIFWCTKKCILRQYNRPKGKRIFLQIALQSCTQL